MKQVFILGCERSGTTWLANIFDAHPDVELLMEPFADFIFIFPGLPTRNIYLSHPQDRHIQSVKKGYQRLPRLKYPFFYKSGRPLYLKKWDGFLFSQCKRVLRKFHLEMPLKLLRYYLLHLNTLTIPISQQSGKNRHPGAQVTKELRLNFKIGLISRVFSDALYLIILRHPGAQISSIRRLFRKDSLSELNQSLQTFFKDIAGMSRFEKYGQLIDRFDGPGCGDEDIQLILWWLINYEVLLEDLDHHGCKFQLVFHEEISEKPPDAVCRVFDFVGLEVVDQVQTYLERSSNTQLHTIESNVDTNRDSANYYKQAINAVDPVLNDKIQQVIGYHGELLAPGLRNYLEKFYHF
ncbi:MAG: sulfotransferase [Candidatus Aminicenantes bacterium]|nr:MAG: sulfotransferase [Candidatus Aminicenantes bacterium]